MHEAKGGGIKGGGLGSRFGTGKPAGCALSLSITIDAQTCKRGMDSENAKKPAWSGQESLMKKICDKLKG